MSFYTKPKGMSFPIGKFLLLIVTLQIVFTFVIWLGRTFILDEIGLRLSDVILGSIPGLIAVLNRRVWRMEKRPRRLFVYVIKLLFHIYISGLAMLATILSWNVLLTNSGFVNGIIIATYICAWVLPWIFPSLSQRLYDKQWEIGGFALGLSGIAGIIGAFIGLHGNRKFSLLASAILMGAIAVGWAQYAGYEIWENRPWAQ